MKKVLSVALLFVLLFGSSLSEGVFVPTYATFMDRMCERIPTNYVDVLKLGFTDDDGSWRESSYFGDYDLAGKNEFQVKPDIENGYIDEFEITISQSAYESYSDDFNSFIDATILSIRDDLTETDVDSIKTELLITTIISTPVDTMYQSFNSGIYRFAFEKSYGNYCFRIKFSLN